MPRRQHRLMVPEIRLHGEKARIVLRQSFDGQGGDFTRGPDVARRREEDPYPPAYGGPRAQWRKRSGKPRSDQLKEMAGFVETSEPILAQVGKMKGFNGRRLEMGGGLRRNDHLPAVSRVGDAGGLVDGERHIVSSSGLSFSGVHTDADADARIPWPAMLVDGVLHGAGRLDRQGRLLEGKETPVALRLDLHPAKGRRRLADQPAMLVLKRRIARAQAREELGRALDVGEAEAHRPARQRVHFRPLSLIHISEPTRQAEISY